MTAFSNQRKVSCTIKFSGVAFNELASKDIETVV
jgi:hypothetical protein